MRFVPLLLMIAALSGCKGAPHVTWPDTQAVVRPPLLPLDQILGGGSSVTAARGDQLAAEAAALRARAAAIAVP